jgi:hypothetical protein
LLLLRLPFSAITSRGLREKVDGKIFAPFCLTPLRRQPMQHVKNAKVV